MVKEETAPRWQICIEVECLLPHMCFRARFLVVWREGRVRSWRGGALPAT